MDELSTGRAGMREETTPTGKPRRKARWWLVLGAAGLLAIWLPVGLRYITFVEGDAPRSTDAVYVLGPAEQERVDVGRHLVEQGLSSQLVVTAPANTGSPMKELCDHGGDYTVYCVTPDPVNTRGEMHAFTSLAREHGWESVMIVTMPSHMSRTEVAFSKCFSGEIVMIDDGTRGGLIYQVQRFLYESGAFVKYFITPSC